MPRKSIASPVNSEREPLLGTGSLSDTREEPNYRTRHTVIVIWIILLNLIFSAIALFTLRWAARPHLLPGTLPPFYAHVTSPQDICPVENRKSVSHSGHIGLEGDSEDKPKRSFFWYFEALENPEKAPLVLTIGGGPGTSGMANALLAQSHCLVTENGTVPNPNGWTERFNLLALDHPIGAGFSYGTMVNNSRAAAIDVYDFLQKFYSIFPHLAKNDFVVSGGSMGGIYVPHIATVIHEQNHAIALGKGRPGAIHINLASLIISNPFSDALSHFRWFLYQACHNTNLYNSTTCTELYTLLPSCLESIQFAYENSTVDNRVAAWSLCQRIRWGDTHGVMGENVHKSCDGSVEDCFPQFKYLANFMNDARTKQELGVPDSLEFQTLSGAVQDEFMGTGDLIQQSYLLYEPLLKDGVQILHYIGAQDANCGWPGVFSFLKLLPSPYQHRFINAQDLPWPSSAEATVRVVGEGAGDMTYILVADAGHFVAWDQPRLAKKIVEHWIDNRPFV
ncbi:alpha/beta-hydrolase [Ramaria rubella]|nr:alpha/beta-hydrolase [Ramaria rubella]